jgi:hypothetical protein
VLADELYKQNPKNQKSKWTVRIRGWRVWCRGGKIAHMIATLESRENPTSTNCWWLRNHPGILTTFAHKNTPNQNKKLTQSEREEP